MMNARKIKIILSLLMGFFFLVANSHTIYAADPATSNAWIEFIQPEDAPDILNPETGEPEYQPTEDEGSLTGQTGPLTLDFVSNLEFGIHEVEIAEKVYESKTMTPYIQVSDRRGLGSGWNVTAQASSFSSDGAATLPGAFLTLRNGEALTNLKDLASPTVNQNIELYTNGEAINIVTANENEGLGSWITRWLPSAEATLNDHATLTIPQAAASPGRHVSTLTWTLTDAPGQ